MGRIKSKLREMFINGTEALFFSKKLRKENDDILILKLDQIGDYILFRNFIEELYKHYNGKRRIVLCGNIVWKDLAEKLDKEFISEFIWVDLQALEKSQYLFSVHRKLIRTKCATLLHPVYSRTLEADSVAIYSGARNIIGWDGDDANISPEIKKENNKKYTKLFNASSEPMFEFYRNRSFFEQYLNSSIKIDVPYIKANKAEPVDKKYIMMFPGAGREIKRWSTDNFAGLYKLLEAPIDLPVLIGGSSKDKPFAQEIIAQIGTKATDVTGQMSLSETVDAIQQAVLVITNDSGPLHISVALNTPTVCISYGENYGRFCPYPSEMKIKLVAVFPDDIDKAISKGENIRTLLNDNPGINVNSVKPEKVLLAIKNGFLN